MSKADCMLWQGGVDDDGNFCRMPPNCDCGDRNLKRTVKIPFTTLLRIYNMGYQSGHHDTVEGCYTDIFECDMEKYHEEDLTEMLDDLEKGGDE